MAKTKAPPTKAEWVKIVDRAVFKEAPSIASTSRDASVRNFAREAGVPAPALSDMLWRNQFHIVSAYGPLGPDLRMRSRFIGADMRWDDCAERLYDLTDAGAEQAAHEIIAFLRVGPSRLMNVRENMRDVSHYVREMQRLDRIAADTRPRLSGVTGFQLLDAYRREFKNALAGLQGTANQLLATPRRAAYLVEFEKSPLLAAINGLRNQDVHNILTSLSIGTRFEPGKAEATFVTFDSSYLAALGPTLPLDLQWRVPSKAASEALNQLAAIVDNVPRP